MNMTKVLRILTKISPALTWILWRQWVSTSAKAVSAVAWRGFAFAGFIVSDPGERGPRLVHHYA